MRKHFLKMMAGGLVLVFVLAGCSSNSIPVDKIVDKAVKAQEKLNSYHAVVSTDMSMGGKEQKITTEEWMEKPNKHRIESSDGTTMVSNGEKSWMYNKKENTVMVDDSLENMQDNGTPDQSEMMKSMVENMVDNNTIDYKGKEKVSGRQTIHVSLEPKKTEKDMPMPADKMEMWFDQKTWMPLKIVTKGDQFESTIEYKSIEYNKKMEDDVFVFTPPEDAKVKQMDDVMPKQMSIEEIRKQADFDVPEITDLPQGYELKNSMFAEKGNTVTLDYQKDQKNMIDLTIVPKEDGPGKLPGMKDSESVDIGGSEGKLVNLEGMNMVHWEKDGLALNLIVQGSDLDKDSAVQIAKSIK